MMESSDRPSRNNQGDQDIELGVLLYKAAREVKRFFQAIGRGFAAVGVGILESLFFLRKNILWLIAGGVVGWLYGLYLHSSTGSKYYSVMTIRANFNSARALYKGADFFNALTNQGKYADLSALLGVSQEEAKSLLSFQVTAIENENDIIDLYKDKFLKYERNDRLREDTFWVKTMKYSQFKDGLTKFDFPLQEVSVVSTNPLIFSKIQQGFIDQISKSPLLSRQRDAQLKFGRQEDSILYSSIQGLDSLRAAYNTRLIHGGTTTEGTNNNFTLVDKPIKSTAPELELYDKLLEVKDELRDSRARMALSSDIFELYSPINPVGQPVSIIKQSMTRYALLGLLITLLIIVGIKFYRYLGSLEKSIRHQRSEVSSAESK